MAASYSVTSNNGVCSVSGSGSGYSGCGSISAPPQSFYFDEKWKLSKKENSLSRSRSSSSCPLVKNSSQRRCSFTRKCARLVKEQRARFYIVRRCVTMLICWRDYSDS